MADEAPFASQPPITGARAALRIQDRLNAPNTEATREAIEPEVRSVLSEIYGGADFTLRHENDPKSCFGLQIEAEGGVSADWPGASS